MRDVLCGVRNDFTGVTRVVPDATKLHPPDPFSLGIEMNSTVYGPYMDHRCRKPISCAETPTVLPNPMVIINQPKQYW